MLYYTILYYTIRMDTYGITRKSTRKSTMISQVSHMPRYQLWQGLPRLSPGWPTATECTETIRDQDLDGQGRTRDKASEHKENMTKHWSDFDCQYWSILIKYLQNSEALWSPHILWRNVKSIAEKSILARIRLYIYCIYIYCIYIYNIYIYWI
jgi:hypothetical protein